MTAGTTDRRSAQRDRWYRDGWYSKRTCVDALTCAATRYAEVPVVFAGAERVTTTVGDIHARAVAVAAALQDLGVVAGDAVAVQLPNVIECAIACEAALLAAAVLVPIVHIYGPHEVEFILAESAAKILIAPDRWRSTRYTDRFERLLSIPSLEHVVVVGDDVPDRCLSWSAWRGSAYKRPGPGADDICLLIYTSGTTSAPKGVQHSHNSLLAEVSAMPALGDGARPDDMQLVTFPPGHIAGVVSMLRPLIQGGSVIYLDSWDPSAALRLIAEFGVTSTAGTPVRLARILDLVDAGARVPSLREFLVGAAAVRAELGRRAHAAGIATFRCYGATEHPTISAGRPDEPLDARLHTDGVPLPGVEVRIIGDDGRDVETGVDGEVVTRGPDQFVGYRDRAMDAAAFTADGWLRTGDLGHLDADGRLTITDRIKDIIIRGGETISSAELEDVLCAHPAVQALLYPRRTPATARCLPLSWYWHPGRR
jgi:acyl-CoA synthetase (AMP-forming)/AMP-acid ligase II